LNATHGSADELTGLASRRSILLGLRRLLLQANERQSTLGVLVVDLDGFARINAAHGYAFGDALLCEVAARLRRVLRPLDLLGRLDGDRFLLLLPRLMNIGHLELAIEKVLRQFDLPFEHAGQRLHVAVTLGVAMAPLHASQPDHLLRLAERGLAVARAEGQRYRQASTRGDDEALSEFWDIEIELAGALQRGELSLHYQPKRRLADGAVVGAEALMRWNIPTRGPVPPARFIPVAEKTGQIKPLTLWALNAALRQANAWQHRFGRLSVAVNVPPEMIAQHDLPELVDNARQLWGDDDVELVLEITERSLAHDPQHSFRVLSALREQGVRISIDDFGTGYSCLAYFKDIPADELKIDRSFVAGLLHDPACADITSLIVELAHRFRLSVVAEGVEDAGTLAALRALGCDVAQGYLLGRPLSQDDFQAWLSAPPRVE
jgi:diguanylate cyclase (GGDEF)-like protein